MKSASHKKANTTWLHLRDVSEIIKFTESKSRMVVAKDWGKGNGNGELVINKHKVSVIQDNEALETCWAAFYL